MDQREHLILYVDDERANRVVFETTFGKKFRIQCVESGPAALAVLAQEPVAVVVTDQRMPEMSGEVLLQRFKELSPETLRIVVTAYSDLEPILHAVNQGLVVRYIVKPWDREELGKILQWAVEAYAFGRHDNALQLRLLETERLLTLGQMSTFVLHDISGVISTLTGNIDILAEEIGVELPPILEKLAAGEAVELDEPLRSKLALWAQDLPSLASDALAAVNLVNDLVRWLRNFQDKKSVSDEERNSDPNDALKSTVSLCRNGAVKTSSRLAYEGPTDLPHVRATKIELVQILVNLVRNAQQAIGSLGERGREVVIHAAEQERLVRFAVADTGPGMSPETLEKIGTPFFTTRAEGTGLGVAQCKRLVGGLGGDFDIQSTAGRGTTVTFTIPKVD